MIKFEWDEEKDWSNYLKHGIFFEEAKVIWTDSNAIEFLDEYHSQNEDRYIRIGMNIKFGLLMVVFCERENEIVRLISARKATLPERVFYERQL